MRAAGAHHVDRPGTAAAVVALDPATGKTLWTAEIEFNNGNHLTPAVQCGDGHLWVGSQFGSGGGRLLAIRSGEAAASVSWSLPTLVGTTLYVRDQQDVLALDLK